MKLEDGKTHRISYIDSKLYLDGVLIAEPGNDVILEFEVALDGTPENLQDVHVEMHPEFLEVNVHDDMTMKDVPPGGA